MVKRYTQPLDASGKLLQAGRPTATSLARSVKTVTSSQAVELNDETRMITVYAISKDVFLKWASSDTDYATASNFDEVIPAGSVFDFEVPYNSEGVLFGFVTLVGRESGATAIVIEK